MSSSKRDPRAVVQATIEYLLGHEDKVGHDTVVLRELKIISASYKPMPCTTLRLKVTRNLCNRIGNLHGGATATIFDDCTGFLIFLVREEGFWASPGVSRTINVAYLAAVKEGEEVEVEVELVSISKRLAHCKGIMRRAKDGVVAATCEHGIVKTGPPSSKL